METDFGTLDTETAEAVKTAEVSVATPKVIGRGLYLELTGKDKTTYTGKRTLQILITPSGKDEKGNGVSMAIIYRTIANFSPRSQWRVKFLSNGKLAKITDPALLTEELYKELIFFVGRQSEYGSDLIQGKPMVFEVSNLDLTDVRQG